jgi:hypothetical protein
LDRFFGDGLVNGNNTNTRNETILLDRAGALKMLRDYIDRVWFS